MAEQFHQGRKGDAGAKHLGGIGMPQLMRDDARGNAERMADLTQVIAKAMKERVLGAGTGQKPSIRRQRIKETKESEALDEFTYEGVHGDQALGFELAERHMNRPLTRPGRVKAVVRQIGAFTDAHTGVANQQKDIAAQIVAAEEFLLQELVLLCRQWAWKSLRAARNILASDEMSEFGKLFAPRQFVQDGAQSDKPADIGCGHQRRYLRAQAGHPAQDVGVTAQLVEAIHLGVIGAKID